MATHTDHVCGMNVADQKAASQSSHRGILATLVSRAAERGLMHTPSNPRFKTRKSNLVW